MTPDLERTTCARSPEDRSMTNRFGQLSLDRGLRRRAIVARRAASALAIGVIAGVVLGTSVAPALADSCANAAVRAQNNSAGLPDCRAYELVTPPFKEGFAPNVARYVDDGNALTYISPGQFAGTENGGTTSQYLATRSVSGWVNTTPTPAPPAWANLLNGDAAAMSADLRSSLWLMARADESSEVLDFYLRSTDGAFTRVGPGPNPATLPPASPGDATGTAPLNMVASSDLSRVMFTLNDLQIYPGTVVNDGAPTTLYSYQGTGNDRPQLVGVDNAGQQISPCSSFPGSGRSAYRAMSMDGRVIFWTELCTPYAGIDQVWARVNGTTTYHVSASQCNRTPADPGGACNAPASAFFEGANAEGTRVYFTTTQQLVDADVDEANDLYACDLPPGAPAPVGTANSCSALKEVSGGATDANVEGVVRVSDDGSRVYFVAQGVIAANLGANGATAVAGEDNLYVWTKDAAHPSGQTAFVGRLDPSDAGLWNAEVGADRMAQTTDNGRYLVLSTFSPLVAGGPTADTDAAEDVYRYDADTGTLVRLSTATSGDGGNASGLDATLSSSSYAPTSATARARTAMTDDATTVVFRTAEALSSADTNDVIDVYAWQDGRVSLISGGGRSLDDLANPPTVAYITASGRDIFFSTTARLTAGDHDTQMDFYDARVGGGFEINSPVSCTGDGCQPPGHGSPPVSGPNSNTPTGQGNLTETTPTFSVRKVGAAARKRLAATGKLTLKVDASTPGTLSAKATATVAGRTTTVASARRTMAAPGAASLTLTLAKKARAQLTAKGKLTVKIAVTSSKVAFSRSVTLKLTHVKAKRKAIKRAASRGVRS